METMQKVPLRVFYRTIDDLILNQQSDAAISRSKCLLQEFPKNLSVYQLLGKAFLDKQEFDDANTVFEKILEIDPDDFVSHIGISIISESFGNLDKALESMRRAYELQPSNESLQNEVKRLQESSTGFAPENIRMTRGTLIKMYSRSQLADQTIAEARLGIHESPDRIDYKIHLAKMLDFSGKNIEAVETCMDIIRKLPYCYAALLILYRRTPLTTDLDDSSVYKSRLSEIDPYFAFMKLETNSVDDIPDIAIMVEERDGSENPIVNFGAFIKSLWETSSFDPVRKEAITQNEDWTSIINEAVSNNNLGTPITDPTYEEIDVNSEEVVMNSEEIDEFQELETQDQQREITAKSKLLNKLRSNDSSPSDKRDVPDWILEENKSDQPNEISASNPDEFLSEDSLSTGFDTDGMTDHDSPINSELDISPPQKQDVLNWEKEHTEHELDNSQVPSDVLDDTQKIKIVSDDPEKLILQAFNSLEEGDFQFAKQCFSKLIQENYQLLDIAAQLENICQGNPEKLDLWLILVEIYKKLGLEEKTLSALVKAQNNLSFR